MFQLFLCTSELSYKYLFFLCCLFLLVFFHNALPFVGFGFLDNAIMIAAVSSLFNSSIKTVRFIVFQVNRMEWPVRSSLESPSAQDLVRVSSLTSCLKQNQL